MCRGGRRERAQMGSARVRTKRAVDLMIGGSRMGGGRAREGACGGQRKRVGKKDWLPAHTDCDNNAGLWGGKG